MFTIYAKLTYRFAYQMLPTYKGFEDRVPDGESFAEHVFRLCLPDLREQERDADQARVVGRLVNQSYRRSSSGQFGPFADYESDLRLDPVYVMLDNYVTVEPWHGCAHFSNSLSTVFGNYRLRLSEMNAWSRD